jgi:hypothetical protein
MFLIVDGGCNPHGIHTDDYFRPGECPVGKAFPSQGEAEAAIAASRCPPPGGGTENPPVHVWELDRGKAATAFQGEEWWGELEAGVAAGETAAVERLAREANLTPWGVTPAARILAARRVLSALMVRE